MKTLIIFLVVIAVVINYIESVPIHHHTHHKSLYKTKELLSEAAKKSGVALKAKGEAALAVAKAPLIIAKKVAAGVVAAKAIAVSKVAAAGAAIKAATAVKAGLIAKKALGIKLKPKVKHIVEEKLHKLKHKLIAPVTVIKDKKKDVVEDGLSIIKHKIAHAAKTALTEPKAFGSKVAEPFVKSLIAAF